MLKKVESEKKIFHINVDGELEEDDELTILLAEIKEDIRDIKAFLRDKYIEF